MIRARNRCGRRILRYNKGAHTCQQCVLSIELSIHLYLYTSLLQINNLVELCSLLVIATAGASRRALRGCLADGLYPIITLFYMLFNIIVQYGKLLLLYSTIVLLFILSLFYGRIPYLFCQKAL